MGTELREVYDLFMQTVTDYRLIDLFDANELDFENYLQSFLEFAIVDFRVCNQDLDFDDNTKLFPVVLSRENKVILSKLMMKHWLGKNVNDITQMNLHITDRDFKVYSEAMNLREKTIYFNTIKEECSQLLIDYGYDKVDWDTWFAQDFSGS